MSIQDDLLRWFAKSARPLPWRKHYRPYEVWVSEIMLQQTQMDTVIPYFNKWMRSFPTVAKLAAAPSSRVLKHWQGLGYYSRARNLHASAQLIVERHGGEFPRDYDAIRALKGVGPYTAGAITSIAYNEERPIVDGNVIRVLSRLYAIDTAPDRDEGSIFWERQRALIPHGKARIFNQAIMELGALVCLPKAPRCPECPVRKHCQALKQDRVGELPRARERKANIRVTAACVAWIKDGRVLLRQRPEGEIFGGLWEMPEWKLSPDSHLPLDRSQWELAQRIGRRSAMGLRPLGTVPRNYTHYTEKLHVFMSDSAGPGPHPEGWPVRWVDPADTAKTPLSSAYVRALALVSSEIGRSSRGKTQKA